MKSASAASLMTTMMLLARTLSFAPRSSSHVITITIPNAGRLTRIGIPPICGAVSSRPWMSGFELRSAVRYPVVSQTGNDTPMPRVSVVK